MLLGGDARQRGKRLALAAAGENDEPLIRLFVDVLDLDEDVTGHLDVAELLGDRQVVDHRTADHGHLPLVAGRRVESLLDAVDVGREGRDDDPAGTLTEQLLEGLPDGALGRGEAIAFRVRTVRHQQHDAVVPEVRQARHVGRLAIDGRLVHLEVGGVDHHADRRLDGERGGVGDAVRNVDELDFEGAELHDIAGLDLA